MPDGQSNTANLSNAASPSLRGDSEDAETHKLRSYGFVNWLGLYTLYIKEVRRFIKVWLQTIAAPTVSTLLFMIVFAIAFEARVGDAVGALDHKVFNAFLAPGLIIMAILNNAFQNTSSSMTIAKVQGSTTDFLTPPLSSAELALAFLAGAATRGVLVAVVSSIGISLSGLADMSVHNVWAVLYFALIASFFMAAVGLIGGIWAEKFDHLAAIANFVIMPLSFLSGTFYSVKDLPPVLERISQFNPFFYMIDGFRYGFIGKADSNLWYGAGFCMIVTLVTILAAYILLRRGYKLKA